jgi:integrase/recombinase XerD
MIKIEPFKIWLQEQDKQSPRSIKEHISNLQRFQQWAEAQQYSDIQNIHYNELLSYVQQQKEQNLKVQTIQKRLNSLSKYYEYLKHIGIIEKNPTKKIKLKGVQKTITQNVLSYSELEQLYNDYLNIKPEIKNNPLTPYAKQKNNVLLGLMIWQGAVSGEIEKIILEHVNLDKGTIYIPKSGRGASRELKLHNSQILQLYSYIHDARQKLIKAPVAPIKRKTDKDLQLIPGSAYGHAQLLMQQIKGINQKINNASQLRASIIIHWIKVYGKRQAQYMAGHKYIGSTEKFELQEMDSLTDTLLKHHPFS